MIFHFEWEWQANINNRPKVYYNCIHACIDEMKQQQIHHWVEYVSLSNYKYSTKWCGASVTARAGVEAAAMKAVCEREQDPCQMIIRRQKMF